MADSRSRASHITTGTWGVEVERVAHGFLGVPLGAVEAVDGQGEGDAAPLEVVDGGEAVREPPGVGQHDRAERALGQLVPQEPEALLAGGAEQVEDQVFAQGDPAEVHGDGGGVLAFHPVDVVHRAPRLGQQLFGAQRLDFADGTDEGGLADAEAARDQDLEGHRSGGGPFAAAVQAPEHHGFLPPIQGGYGSALPRAR
ncbi:hypothetical protein GCM10020000_68750 [Streptomyces olivoverticillatus]